MTSPIHLVNTALANMTDHESLRILKLYPILIFDNYIYPVLRTDTVCVSDTVVTCTNHPDGRSRCVGMLREKMATLFNLQWNLYKRPLY